MYHSHLEAVAVLAAFHSPQSHSLFMLMGLIPLAANLQLQLVWVYMGQFIRYLAALFGGFAHKATDLGITAALFAMPDNQ